MLPLNDLYAIIQKLQHWPVPVQGRRLLRYSDNDRASWTILVDEINAGRQKC